VIIFTFKHQTRPSKFAQHTAYHRTTWAAYRSQYLKTTPENLQLIWRCSKCYRQQQWSTFHRDRQQRRATLTMFVAQGVAEIYPW